MITEQQQEQASLYAVGALTAAEQESFEAELRNCTELSEFVHSLQQTTDLLALAAPAVRPPGVMREKVLHRIEAHASAGKAQRRPPSGVMAGHRFLDADDPKGWKELQIRGAWIKLLSLERERGYAVLLGKLEPGVSYPAHTNAGPEDFYVLTGDLQIGDRRLGPGDFHHADAGSPHAVNYSVEGCTLLAVLTTDDPLVQFAMA